MYKKTGAILVAVFLFLQIASVPQYFVSTAEAAIEPTLYRVYQNDKPLKEFKNSTEAVSYAKLYNYSHVEKIANRSWVWDNFPKYKVYQNGNSSSKWDFQNYEDAWTIASKLSNASIRQLDQIGWNYSTYPKYRLYQGEITLSNWNFVNLEQAKKEAAKWANAHIIDLATNRWVWDNLTQKQIETKRSGALIYELIHNNKKIENTKQYSFLQDAIRAAEAYENSEIRNINTGKVVHSNKNSYSVLQNGKLLHTFISLEHAVQDAKKWANSEVVFKNQVLWSSYPYWIAYQHDKKLKHFSTKEDALAYAIRYANSSVRTMDGRTVWSSKKSLIYMGWNGISTASTILNQVSNTTGIDVISPSWYELADASGKLNDFSNESTVKALQASGKKVMPLLNNQFDAKLTTAFLKDEKAQLTFIGLLISSLQRIGADGINIDFEMMAGKDRHPYTAFVGRLAKAAHSKGLKVSIDLPRGDQAWDHLTAYDQTALAQLVDTIIIMAYDEHWSGSDTSGSVAGLKWVEEGIKQFLNYGVPRNKLMLGIPFYVREWKLDRNGNLLSSRAVPMSSLNALIMETGAKSVPDESSGQLKYTYQKNGFTYQFWAETEETVLKRIALAKKYDLAGVAAWRLGYEKESLWGKILGAK